MMTNSELEKSLTWFKSNRLTLNVKKNKYMNFSDQNMTTSSCNLHKGSQHIDQVGTNCKEKYFKFVGHVIDDKLNWEGHVQHVTKNLQVQILESIPPKNSFP